MSCQIANEKLVALLADYVECYRGEYYGESRGVFSMCISSRVRKALVDAFPNSRTAREIYRDLYEFNFDAYEGRYNQRVDKRAYDEYKRRISAWFTPASDWAERLYYALAFYNYQCAEDATIEKPIYRALTMLGETVADYIAHERAKAFGLKWGEA